MKLTKQPLLKPLTKEEKELLLPILVKMLKQKSSKENPLVSDKIVKWFNNNPEITKWTAKFSKQRLMKLINYLRVNCLLPIISDDKGYYITTDAAEVYQMALSLESRIMSIKAAADGMRYMADELKGLVAKKEIETDVFGFDWDYTKKI